MERHKKNIGIVIYNNPDFYPPLISAIALLSPDYDVVIICRNQERPLITYPGNVKLYRVGRLKTSFEKHSQTQIEKIVEYVTFILRAIFYLRRHRCRLIYSYDMHGFVAGFFASRIGVRIPLLYHNFDLQELKNTRGLGYVVKVLELGLARYADKIIFPNHGRAHFFKELAQLEKFPMVVMNAPLRMEQLPSNHMPQLLKERGLSPDTKIVLFQGTIFETRAILEVVRSMVLWPKDTALVLLGGFGEGFAKEFEREVKALDLASRTIRLPSLPYTQVWSYTVGAHLGLAIYKFEDINLEFMAGASNKIFEYMSCGVPPVVRGTSDMRNMFSSSPVYFAKTSSPEDIACVVNEAFSDEAGYKQKSMACRTTHLQTVNYETQFRPVLEFIQQTIECEGAREVEPSYRKDAGKIKVTVSVSGKFHALHLAEQLQRRGSLFEVFTAYPWFIVKHVAIPRYKVHCLILKEILLRVLTKIPRAMTLVEIDYYTANLFDRQVSKYVVPCDIFCGWSGASLYTIRKIRRSFPAMIILERGSAHIEYQRDVLLQEQEVTGIKLALPNPHLIGKELQEYQEADYISVPSTFARETFIQKGVPPEKLLYTSLGVDICAFYPAPKKDSVFRIISVGVKIIKGTHYLLQAVSELDMREWQLWLLGGAEPDIRLFLKKYARNFTYVGGVPQKSLYRYYSQGSVFVLFSLEDGFGMALLEAMACGLPVICSDTTGAKDVVRDGVDGFIVPSRDIVALKEKLVYLYDNPQICKSMGESGLQRVRNYFTWDHYGTQIMSTYERCFRGAKKNKGM